MKSSTLALFVALLSLPTTALAGGWANRGHDFYRPRVQIQYQGSSSSIFVIEGHWLPTEFHSCSSTKPPCRPDYSVYTLPGSFVQPLPVRHEVRVRAPDGHDVLIGTFHGDIPSFDSTERQFPKFDVTLAEGIELRWKVRSGPPYPCFVLGPAFCYIRRDTLVFRTADGVEVELYERNNWVL